MTLKTFAKCLLAVSLLALTAGSCEQKQTAYRLNLESVPQYYRDCVSKVVTLPDKKVLTYKETVELLFKVRQSELRLSKCGKDVIAWADAQVAAYR